MKKPRRHTTGSSKETQEDLLIAKHFSNEMNENGGKVVNELGQEIDPSSTLGRKQLIGMLKQRYGQDIENYRSSIPPGEKVIFYFHRTFSTIIPNCSHYSYSRLVTFLWIFFFTVKQIWEWYSPSVMIKIISNSRRSGINNRNLLRVI